MRNVKLPKRDVVYKNNSFIITNYDYNIQYFPYYRARLNQMKYNLISMAKHTWPGIPIYTLNDLADNRMDVDKLSQDNDESMEQQLHNQLINKDVVVLGTLLKKMSAQPNILKELDNDRKLWEQINIVDEMDRTNFVSSNDIIFLQEGDEAIELKGDIKIAQLCTGICLAVKGQINPNGSGFIVEDVCFVSHNSSPSKSIERPLSTKDYYILIVSGLAFTNNLISNQKLTFSLNILYDIVAGNSDLILDKTIVNVILAGNNISSKTRIPDKSTEANDKNSSESWNQKNKPNSYEAIKMLDKFLANAGQYIFVDVMPGRTDLSTFLYPQQPLHPCLFPKSSRLTSIRSVTNPHRASYFGVDFLGTSGENLDSIRSSTTWKEPVEIMRNILQWGHVAPTCPDLLHSYPFPDQDPLVLDKYPDVFFAGNQSEFSIGSFITPDGHKNVRLVSVPSFDEKFIGVLVNLRSLDCEMIAFN